jgi:predicted dehydrogenase
MAESMRIGVIGLGYWGPNLARNFFEMNSSELMAVAELDEVRLDHTASRFQVAHATTDYRDFFAMDLDGVAIATPPVTHYPIALDCLHHGLNVLVEKPITLRSQNAAHLIEVARENNLKLMVGHTFEYNPAVREIRRLIEEGELGDIFYIDAVRANLGLFQLNTDAMWDLAPHDISIVNYLLGGTEPQKVNAQGGAFILKRLGVYDLVHIHMQYPDDIVAHIRVSWIDPNKTRSITIVGSKKMLIYDDVSTLEKIKIFDKGIEKLSYSETYEEFQCSYRYGDVTVPHIQWIEPLRVECQHFIDCIQNDWIPQSDGVAGLSVVKTLEAADISLKKGGEILLTGENDPVIQVQPRSA